jgi:hypothetical protein
MTDNTNQGDLTFSFAELSISSPFEKQHTQDPNLLTIIIKKDLPLTEDIQNFLHLAGCTIPDSVDTISISYLLKQSVDIVIPTVPVLTAVQQHKILPKHISIDYRCALNELLQDGTLTQVTYTYQQIIRSDGIGYWRCFLTTVEDDNPSFTDGCGKRKCLAQEEAAKVMWMQLKINNVPKLHQLIRSQLNGTHGEATNDDDLSHRLMMVLSHLTDGCQTEFDSSNQNHPGLKCHISVVVDEEVTATPLPLNVLLDPVVNYTQSVELVLQSYVALLIGTNTQQLVLNLMRLDEFYSQYLNSRIGAFLPVFEILVDSTELEISFTIGLQFIEVALVLKDACHKVYCITTFQNILNYLTRKPTLLQPTQLYNIRQRPLGHQMVKKDINFSYVFKTRLFTTYYYYQYTPLPFCANVRIRKIHSLATSRYDCKGYKYQRRALVSKGHYLSDYKVVDDQDIIHSVKLDSNHLVTIESNPGPTYAQVVIIIAILILMRKFVTELCGFGYNYLHRPVTSRVVTNTDARTINFDNGYDAPGDSNAGGIIFDLNTRPAKTDCSCQFKRELYTKNLNHPNVFRMRNAYTTAVYDDLFVAPRDLNTYYEYTSGTQFIRDIPKHHFYSNFKHYITSDAQYDYYYFCDHEVSHIGSWSSTERLITGNKYMQNAGYGSNTSSNTSAKLTTVQITYGRKFLFKQELDVETFTASINPHTFISDWKLANQLDPTPSLVIKTMQAKLGTLLKNICTDYQQHMLDDYDNLMNRIIHPRHLKPFEAWMIKFGITTPWTVLRVAFTEPITACLGKYHFTDNLPSLPVDFNLPVQHLPSSPASLPDSVPNLFSNLNIGTNLGSLNLSPNSSITSLDLSVGSSINSLNLASNTIIASLNIPSTLPPQVLGNRISDVSDNDVDLQRIPNEAKISDDQILDLLSDIIKTNKPNIDNKKKNELPKPPKDVKNKATFAQRTYDSIDAQHDYYIEWLRKIDLAKVKIDRVCKTSDELRAKNFPFLTPHYKNFSELWSPICNHHCFQQSLVWLGFDIGYSNQFFQGDVSLDYVTWTCEYFNINLYYFVEESKILQRLLTNNNDLVILAYESKNRMHILFGKRKPGFAGLSLYRICPRNYTHIPPAINPMSFYKIRHNHDRTQLFYFKSFIPCSPYKVVGPNFIRGPALYSEIDVTNFLISQTVKIERAYFTCTDCEKVCGTQIGPICPNVMPLVYSDCIGSFFNGLENRWLAGQSVVFRVGDWDGPIEFYQDLLKYFEQLIYEGFNMDYHVWFWEAYLNQTTSKKKLIDKFILDFRRNIARFSRQCKTFIKKEIAVPRDLEKDKSVRLIGNPEDGSQLMAVGRCFDKLLNAVTIEQQQGKYFQYQTTRGLNAPESGQKFLWLITDPGYECFKTIINGDDSLSVYFNGLGFQICLEIDGGRFESTFNSVKIDCELDMARSVLHMMTNKPKDERIKHIEYSLEFMKQFNLRFSFNQKLTATQLASFYNYTMPLRMKRATGAVFTSGGNCFQNLGMLNKFSFHLRNSTELNFAVNIDAATLSLINTGLIPEVKIHRNPWNGSFCSGYFYPAVYNGVEIPIYGPNYKRMAVKLGFNISSATVNVKRIRKTLYLGFRRDFNHLPILRELIDSYNNTERPYKTSVRFKYMGIHVDATFTQSALIYDRLFELYNLVPSEIHAMETDDYSGQSSLFHQYFDSFDNSRYVKLKNFGRVDPFENNSLLSIADIFTNFTLNTNNFTYQSFTMPRNKTQNKINTIVLSPPKNKTPRTRQPRRKQEIIIEKPAYSIQQFKRNTGALQARKPAGKQGSILKTIRPLEMKNMSAGYLFELCKLCVGIIVNPDGYDAIAWPVRQTQPVYPLKTKYTVQVNKQNFFGDAVPTGNTYTYTGNQVCTVVMNANGPLQSVAVTASALIQVNSRALPGYISQIVGTGLTAGIVPVINSGLQVFPLITAGEMELPPNSVPTFWPWELQSAEAADSVIPVGDNFTAPFQMYPIAVLCTNTPVASVPYGSLATVGSPRLAFCAQGSYPAGTIATITLVNQFNADNVVWTVPVSSIRTWVGPSSVSVVSSTKQYDHMIVQLTSIAGGPVAMQGEISFVALDTTNVVLTQTPYHINWTPDEVAATLPATIADSCAVTAASMLITNTSALIGRNGKVYVNRIYPWVGYGTPSGVTNTLKIQNYNSAYLDLPAETGAYCYLPGQTLPFDMIGINNRLAARGFLIASIVAVENLEGGQEFEIVRDTHYNIGSSSQLLAVRAPQSIQSCLEHVTAAIERSAIGTENPKHVKFAADVLKKISTFAASDAVTSLCKMLGVAVPRVANAVDASRDFVAKAAGSAGSALSAIDGML